MTDKINFILNANNQYSKEFNKGDLPAQPKKNIAILTCMDARFDPAKALGLEEGDAHVIRNAGGRVTDDAIRSLVISHKLLATNEWILIQHTDCGMQKISDETIAKLLEDDLETASFDGQSWSNNNTKSENSKPGSKEGHNINWYTFSSLKQSMTEDLKIIKNHSLIPSNIKVHGFIYEVSSGKLIKIEAVSYTHLTLPTIYSV